MTKPNRRKFVKNVLRRASLRWPPRNSAKSKARVARGKYLCNMCKKTFHYSEIQMDHIIPVVDIDDDNLSYTLDTYSERLLPYEDGWQALCANCHEGKTLVENEMRPNKRKIKEKRNKKHVKNTIERAKMLKYLKSKQK